MRLKSYIGTLIILIAAQYSTAGDITKDELLKLMVKRATANEQIAESYGYNVQMATKFLDGNGGVKKTEIRSYRTEWVSNKPRLELIRINGKPLNNDQIAEENKSRVQWMKALHNKESNSAPHKLGITWHELYEKFDFQMLPAQGNAAYVLEFKPKATKLQERNKLEKILNNLTGTLFVDKDYNLLRVNAKLATKVGFGLGILAKIENMDLVYTQQEHNGMMFPASMDLNVRAKFALFKTERRSINVRFSDLFSRNTGVVRAAAGGR